MPKLKPHIKTSISDAQLHSELLKLFESGKTAKANSYELLRTLYKIGKQRCLNAFDKAMLEWQKTRQKADNEQIQANATEALKSGLKSKIERIKDIQNQISELKQKLEQNQDFKYMVIGGKVQKVVCEIDLSTRGYIHKTIKDLESEINKMEGNYANAKLELTGKNGKPIETNNNSNVFIELTTQEIKNISQQLEDQI